MNSTYTFNYTENGQGRVIILTQISEALAVAIANTISSAEGVTDVTLNRRDESVQDIELS